MGSHCSACPRPTACERLNARDYKPRHARKPGMSGSTGVLVGLSVGLSIAGAIYLKDHKTEGVMHASTRNEAKRPVSAETTDEEPGKTYDFYDMLPKFEVVVPEKDREVKPDLRTAPETRPGTYVLQAGSYKNFSDADRIRVQLARQGIESKVQKVSVDTDTWHRIRIGPISRLDELNRLRQQLRKSEVDFIVIRVGD